MLRLALLSAHYRQPLEWTEELLEQTKATYQRWQLRLDANARLNASGADDGVVAALADDLNTPAAMARLSALSKSGDWTGLAGSLALLGFRMPRVWENDAGIDAQVAARTAARAARNFAESDRIRDELAVAGIILEDGPGGTTWRRA